MTINRYHGAEPAVGETIEHDGRRYVVRSVKQTGFQRFRLTVEDVRQVEQQRRVRAAGWSDPEADGDMADVDGRGRPLQHGF